MPLPLPAADTELSVESHLFGILKVPSQQRIIFEEGIPGFEEARDFVLLPAARAGSYWLQSCSLPTLAFFLVEARLIAPEAFGETPDLMAIVTLPGRESPQATANLRAPLLVDRQSQHGVQLIAIDETWSTTHPIDMAALLQ